MINALDIYTLCIGYTNVHPDKLFCPPVVECFLHPKEYYECHFLNLINNFIIENKVSVKNSYLALTSIVTLSFVPFCI